MRLLMNSIFKLIMKIPVKHFLLFFLVVLWACLNIIAKNRFFALFILAFLFLLLLVRKKKLVLVIIPILFTIFFNSTILDGLGKIKSSTEHALNSPSTSLNNLFTANSGKEVLEWDLLWMDSIIKEHELKDYRLSPNLLSDHRISHQIVVSAWPAKMEPTSTNIFISTDEIPLYEGYDLFDTEMDIAFVYRP